MKTADHFVGLLIEGVVLTLIAIPALVFFGYIIYMLLALVVVGVHDTWVGARDVIARIQRRRAARHEQTRPKVGAGPSLEEIEGRWHAVLGAYGAFLSDIVAIASMPLLADPTCPQTDAFQTALVHAEDAHADTRRDPSRKTSYLEAVEKLEQAWRHAQSYARRKGSSTLDEAESDAVRRAQRLLDIALDEHAFGPERREAMRKAVDLLRTVVEIPAQAVAAIDHRVQRLELES